MEAGLRLLPGRLSLSWGPASLLSCLALAYSFLVYFKPSEPYLTDYLLQKGFSQSQVLTDIFPWWTYSYCLCLLLLGAVCEFVGYRLCMLLGALGLLLASLLLLLPFDASDAFYLALLRLDQLADGLGSASQVVHSAYLFHVVHPSHTQLVASYSRALQLLSSVASSFLGGVLAEFTPLTVLFGISSCSMFLVLCLVPFFPDTTRRQPTVKGVKTNAGQLVDAVRVWATCRWLLYSACATCVHQLALTYVQALFQAAGGDAFWNGFVYSLAYLLAGLAALLPALLPLHRLSSVLLLLVPLANGILLLLMAFTQQPCLLYLLFFLYHSLFELLAPMSSALVAQQLGTSRYALVFAYNAAFSLILQSLLQFSVDWLQLSLQAQFAAFGVSLLLSALLLAVGELVHVIRQVCGPEPSQVLLDPDRHHDDTSLQA